MFKNRKTLHQIMYVLAIIMILAMLAITIGPGLFNNQ
jgi:hypothetical protein